MLPPVQFSAVHRRFRDEWFDMVETPYPTAWIDQGAVGEGESESVHVLNQSDGMRGVAKPGPRHAGQTEHLRAAHERLAFDLSCLVSLPISPVILWPHEAPSTYLIGRSISCWAFPQAMKWDEADGKGLITPAAKASVAPLIAAGRVFHSWIGDQDRKGSHIILDLDSPDGHANIAFIDHGHSMSLYWKGPDANTPACPKYLADVPDCDEAVIETADHIASINESEIRRVVDRIPALYLPDAERAHIVQNLLARKGNLRSILGV